MLLLTLKSDGIVNLGVSNPTNTSIPDIKKIVINTEKSLII
jgi:hypothetical protein